MLHDTKQVLTWLLIHLWIKALKTLVWHLSREPVKTSPDEQDKGLKVSGDELIWGWTPSGDKVGISLRHIAVIDIFNKKRKCCNHRCPDSVDFYTLLLIIYLTAIETLICRREMIYQGLLPSVLHKIRHMIFPIPYWTHSGIVFDKCHKNPIDWIVQQKIDRYSIKFRQRLTYADCSGRPI